jgi:predicted GNAT superfamily acetyltransferase
VSLIQIYIDEDAVRRALVHALRSHGVIVLTAFETGLSGMSDEQQLGYASDRECVLYSHRAFDFFRLHAEWVGTGRQHAGMILDAQQRDSIGHEWRRILRIWASASAESIRNRVEFLTNWD